MKSPFDIKKRPPEHRLYCKLLCVGVFIVTFKTLQKWLNESLKKKKNLWTIWKKWKTAFKKMDKKLFHGPMRKARQQTKHCFHWTYWGQRFVWSTTKHLIFARTEGLVCCVLIKMAVKVTSAWKVHAML